MRKLWQTLEGISIRMITTTRIGTREEPYPMIENVWDFFSKKGTKTIFISVGTGQSSAPDLEFAETIGCPILKLDTPENIKKWTEVKTILQTRKPTEQTTEFAKVAARKWVLPKNLILREVIPALTDGTIQENGETISTKKWFELVKEHCLSIGLTEEDIHIDMLKLDQCAYEASVLHSLWHSGFRPSLVLIHWTSSPDSELQTLLSAAQLQMLGYVLVGKEGNRFLYYYTDVNYYETTSWEIVSKRFENPFIANLLKAVYPGAEGNIVQFPLEK